MYFDDKYLYENLYRSFEEKDLMKYGIWYFFIVFRIVIFFENYWIW